MKSKKISTMIFMVIALAMITFNAPVSAQKQGVVTTPVITCGNPTKTTIDVTVCAPGGGTGLPAGFSVQWMKCSDFENGTGFNNPGEWPADSDAAAAAGVLCKASFSGNAFESNFNLSPGQCVTVTIGSPLFDNGASTICPNDLDCNTCYVFRAFGHATKTLNRSAFTTTNPTCTTLSCGGCVRSQGYWRTHLEDWPTSLTICGQTYDSSSTPSLADLQNLMNKSASGGNAVLSLAHQLIAATLNQVVNGATAPNCQNPCPTLATVSGGIFGSATAKSQTGQTLLSIKNCLEDYNLGRGGVPQCPEDQE